MGLRITNMVLTGKLPFSEIDICKVIKKSKFCWIILREDISPILQTRIEKPGLTSTGKKKCAAISLFRSGTINIVGVISKGEADKYYDMIVRDLKGMGF